MPGVFFLVVGPSGVGKDTLIDGARRAEPDLVIARRVITRPAGSPGEDHEALDEAAFARQADQGAFLITWGAHDLRYGLRRELLDHLAQGRHVLANGSRTVIGELAGKVPHLVVVEVTAPPELLRDRILSRGRENAEQAGKRLERRAEVGESACVLRVMNDGTPEAGVSRFLAALRAAMAPAAGRAAIDAKLSGMSLTEDQYAAIIDDIVAGRLNGATIDAFLMHAVEHLDDAEVNTLARTGTRVAHCPSSNLKLGSGIARIPELLEKGVQVSIGADGAPCNNNLDGFLELRLAALLHKHRTGPRSLPAPEVVRLATMGGAAALGLADRIGSLEVGKRGDMIAVDLSPLHTVPTSSPWSAIAYAAKACDVRHVAVDGKLVVRDRALLTLELPKVREHAVSAARRLFG